MIAEQDPYVPADLAVSTAGDLGGTVVRFADQGHWWMIGNPAAAAGAGRLLVEPRLILGTPSVRRSIDGVFGD